MQPLITIFSAPKPFRDEHISMIQMNAIRSWQQLGNQVAVVLIGDEEGIREAAEELGVGFIPDVARNSQGTPLISSIFALARSSNESPLLAYVNADIILFEDFIDVALKVQRLAEKFLIVGQRFDLDVKSPVRFTSDWQIRLKDQVKISGRYHPRGGSDYFIYARACFQQIPEFAVGRAGWDNWMFYEARRQGWQVVDATGSILIIHQDHDYAHLPGGQAHYRLPETGENVRLAGGKRTIFTLQDANYTFSSGKLTRIKKRGKDFWREVEIFPLTKLKSRFLGNLTFGLFHPRKAIQEIRAFLYAKRVKAVK